MIQRITKDSDIKFCVSDDSKIQDKFIIKFYTTDRTATVTRTAEDVIVENDKRYIKLNWTSLKALNNGMLNYEVNNLDSDVNYNDGVYNSTFTRTTYYYIFSDAVTDISDLSDKLEQAISDIANETTERKSEDKKLDEAIKSERARAEFYENSNLNNIKTLQTNYSGLSSYTAQQVKTINDKINTNTDNISANTTAINNLTTSTSAKYTSIDAALTSEIDRAKSAEKATSDMTNALKSSLNSEISRAKSAESTNATNITNIDNRVTALEKQGLPENSVLDLGTY